MCAKGIVIGGLCGGSGKSIISVGLTAALAGRGRMVVPFKKGPDYIEAGWLQIGAGRRCYNLDPFLMTRQAIEQSFLRRSRHADIVIVEGNRGLYDGVDVDGGYSTAELSLILNLPLVLVVNCSKVTRTVAALVTGCIKFDERVDIRGVILNRIGTKRQQRLITESVEKYTGVPVLGAIPRLKKDIFPMRHLGMIPHHEYRDSGGALSFLRDLVLDNIDLQRVEQVMAPVVSATLLPKNNQCLAGGRVKIGVLQDEAFQFYYSENLEALEEAGAELVYVNALRDGLLPPVDGLYIGGGFPETSARELAENRTFRRSIKKAAQDGLPIYAECGGLIYLGSSLFLEGEEFPLAGIFPAKFSMSKRPQAHGYSIFQVVNENGFYAMGTEVKGHEFRYSKVVDWRGNDDQLALKMVRGKGFINGRDGLMYKNVFALYTHVHAEGTPEWAANFVRKCASCL